MIRSRALCAALAFAAARASAADGGFSTKSFGEGGGYKHPDSATQQYLDEASHPPATDPAAAAPAAAAPKEAVPAPAALAAYAPAVPVLSRIPAPPPAHPRLLAPPRAPEPAVTAAGAPAAPRHESLWNGLVQPLDVAAAEIQNADADAAREGAERDYESRILGQAPEPRRPRLAAAPEAGATPAPAPDSGGRVFVSLEIDAREAGTLRDAVADLGASSGFAADARFEPRGAAGGGALVSGWLPAERLGDVLARRGVKSVRVETRPRPFVARQTTADFLVGLRVDDPSRAREVVAAGLRTLSARVSFRALRVVGLETAPDGRAVAVVAGRLPLAQLQQALALPEVVKISPLDIRPAPPAPETRAGGVRGFARFTVERGLWLLVFTLLLCLPSLRAPAKRLAGVLSPYH